MTKKRRGREPLTKLSIYPPESMHDAILQMADSWGISMGQMYILLLREGMRVEQAKRLAASGAGEKEILRLVTKGENRYGL